MPESVEHAERDASSPQLEEARRAYQRGDFASVRRVARGLLREEKSEEVRAEAELILCLVRPDRAAIILALACLAFFVAVLWAYVF